MLTFLIFLAILALLVLVHELGHFLVARLSGVKVYEFGFGFPPRIVGVQLLKSKNVQAERAMEIIDVKTKEVPLSDGGKLVEEIITDTVVPLGVNKESKKWRIVWGDKPVEEFGDAPGQKAGTIYSLNWIPLGGFVRIKGEDGTAKGAFDSDSFTMKSVWKKSAVLVAGVLMNILCAGVLLSVGYMIGIPQTTDGGEAVRNSKLQVLQVVEGKPAAAAGLETGDNILKVDSVLQPKVADFQSYVDANKGKEINLEIERGGVLVNVKVKPEVISETGKGGIGVAIAEVGLVKYPWYKAIYYGFAMTMVYLKEILMAFLALIVGIFKGNGVGGAVSGPVGVAVMTGQVAKMGLSYLIQFTAMLSLNLAVLNILPVPSLDGGRLMFVWLGKIFGERLKPKFEQVAHSIGFALLMLLVVVVTVRDLGIFKNIFINFFHKIF